MICTYSSGAHSAYQLRHRLDGLENRGDMPSSRTRLNDARLAANVMLGLGIVFGSISFLSLITAATVFGITDVTQLACTLGEQSSCDLWTLHNNLNAVGIMLLFASAVPFAIASIMYLISDNSRLPY